MTLTASSCRDVCVEEELTTQPTYKDLLFQMRFVQQLFNERIERLEFERFNNVPANVITVFLGQSPWSTEPRAAVTTLGHLCGLMGL